MYRSITTACLTLALVSAAPVSGREALDVSPPDEGAAPIALLVDLSSGQTLYARDIDRRFIPASITKVMTALVAFNLMDEGRLAPDQQFAVSENAYENWHRVGSTMFLDADSTPTVEELLMGITTVSANDGCIVLAEGAVGSVDKWVALMNATAREIGMKDSHFGTPNGWPDDGRTFVTAHDLAALAKVLTTRHPDKYARYFGHRGLRTNGFAQSNHDPISGIVEGADGVKTGFTRQAGHGFLGSAERDGRRLVMVVAASDSDAARAQAAREFMEWGFVAFESRKLFAAGADVGLARVQDGMNSQVPLKAPQAIRAAFPSGTQRAVKLAIHYDGPLRAPIEAGEKVAELAISVEGLPEARVPLVAAQSVPQANIWQRFRNGLSGLVS